MHKEEIVTSELLNEIVSYFDDLSSTDSPHYIWTLFFWVKIPLQMNVWDSLRQFEHNFKCTQALWKLISSMKSGGMVVNYFRFLHGLQLPPLVHDFPPNLLHCNISFRLHKWAKKRQRYGLTYSLTYSFKVGCKSLKVIVSRVCNVLGMSFC